MGAMRVSGKLISVEHASGTMTPKDGTPSFKWENATVKIFDGREVVVIKAKRDGLAPALALKGLEGEDVTVEVDSPRSVDTYTFSVSEAATI